MRLELGKSYRCRNGSRVTVTNFTHDGAAVCSVNNGQSSSMRYSFETGTALSAPSSYDVIEEINTPNKDIKPVCTPITNSKTDADNAARDLLVLLRDDLGITTDISPTLLRLWLNERWEKLSRLAHKIHGAG